MRSWGIAVLAACTVLSGCASGLTSREAVVAAKPRLGQSEEAAWNAMVGRWYGSQPTADGGVYRWIMDRSPRGTYEMTGRVYDGAGHYEERVEVGQWGISGPVYFSIYRGWIEGRILRYSDPTDPYNYDAYRIIRLTGEVFEYEAYDTKSRYVVRKVPPDFKLPD
jgi:hypothetical protein